MEQNKCWICGSTFNHGESAAVAHARSKLADLGERPALRRKPTCNRCLRRRIQFLSAEKEAPTSHQTYVDRATAWLEGAPQISPRHARRLTYGWHVETVKFDAAVRSFAAVAHSALFGEPVQSDFLRAPQFGDRLNPFPPGVYKSGPIASVYRLGDHRVMVDFFGPPRLSRDPSMNGNDALDCQWCVELDTRSRQHETPMIKSFLLRRFEDQERLRSAPPGSFDPMRVERYEVIPTADIEHQVANRTLTPLRGSPNAFTHGESLTENISIYYDGVAHEINRGRSLITWQFSAEIDWSR